LNPQILFSICLSFASAKHIALTKRNWLLYAANLFDLRNVSIATPTLDEWASE
jgi:hypothetical protein